MNQLGQRSSENGKIGTYWRGVVDKLRFDGLLPQGCVRERFPIVEFPAQAIFAWS